MATLLRQALLNFSYGSDYIFDANDLSEAIKNGNDDQITYILENGNLNPEQDNIDVEEFFGSLPTSKNANLMFDLLDRYDCIDTWNYLLYQSGREGSWYYYQVKYSGDAARIADAIEIAYTYYETELEELENELWGLENDDYEDSATKKELKQKIKEAKQQLKKFNKLSK